MPLVVATREMWRAVPRRVDIPLHPPVSHVFYSCTRSPPCLFKGDCKRKVAFIQTRCIMVHRLDDIRYSFLVAGDGRIYEGRGWRTPPHLPPKYRHLAHNSIYIGFLGGFTKLKDESIDIVPRKEWGARSPFYTDPLRTPVATVLFTATHPFAFPWCDKDKAYSILRDLQTFHMYQKIMPDVQYNFMIDENGTIYEGRGWYTKPSMSHAEKKPANLNSIYIGYIGEMEEDGPSDLQMKSGNDLISFGMREELIRYHHHISGMIVGIVGTTLEECLSRRRRKPD